MLARESRSLLLLLSALVALGPLSTDMYLPALPAMVEGLETSISSVQLTISSYLAGFALFHLVCGPLADRYGRRPILLAGLAIFAVATYGCVLSEDIETLLFWRFVQGVGACTGPTLGRAMVRDIYGARAARALALLAAIMALAPVVAPTLGGWLIKAWPWQVIFWVLLGYALCSALALWFWVPETLPEVMPLKMGGILRNYLHLLANGRFSGFVMAASVQYAGAFAFLSGSSFILIDLYGVAPEQFGLWFMFIVVGYMLGNVFTASWGGNWPAGTLMVSGGLLATVAGAIMIALLLAGIRHPLAIVGPMALYTASVGISMPHAMAEGLAPFPRMAGTASALMGFCQMGVASLAGALVGWTLTTSALPMAYIITVLGAASMLIYGVMQIKQKRSGA